MKRTTLYVPKETFTQEHNTLKNNFSANASNIVKAFGEDKGVRETNGQKHYTTDDPKQQQLAKQILRDEHSALENITTTKKHMDKAVSTDGQLQNNREHKEAVTNANNTINSISNLKKDVASINIPPEMKQDLQEETEDVRELAADVHRKIKTVIMQNENSEQLPTGFYTKMSMEDLKKRDDMRKQGYSTLNRNVLNALRSKRF